MARSRLHFFIAPRYCAIRATSSIMKTQPPVPRAILVGIQVPSVDDFAHAASIEELGRLVKTLGYEVVGTISQKRDGIGGGGGGRAGGVGGPAGGTAGAGGRAPHTGPHGDAGPPPLPGTR